jgi:branched-chain amino acid transport system substrate-binding protein
LESETKAGVSGETTIGTDTLTAWVDWTNAHGGIAGHPIRLYQANDNNDPAQAQAALNNMVNSDHIVALVGSDAAGTQPSWDAMMEKAGIPVIGGVIATADYNTNPDLYATSTTVESAVYGGEYVMKQEGYTKEALLQCNNRTVCIAGVPLFKLGAKALGIDMVYAQTASELATDYTAQCLSMKASGAQVVVATVNAQLLAENCKTQGYTPVYINSDDTFTPAQIKNTSAFEGSLGFRQGFPTFPSARSIPQLSEYFQAMDQYESAYMAGGSKADDNILVFSASAWSGGYVFGEAIANANVPAGQTVTTSDVKRGLAMIPQGSTNGGYTPPVYYGDGSTTPEKAVNCFWTDKIVNGQYQLLPGPNALSSVSSQCEPTALLHFK